MSRIGEIIKEERVKEGKKARYPYSDEYETPQKQGYIFDGWKYNGQVKHPPFNDEIQNPFGPINEDTNITAVWDKIDSLHSESTPSQIPFVGNDDLGDPTLLSYWLSTVGGKNIAEGIGMEPVVDSDVEQYPIVFINSQIPDRVENGKNIKSVFIAPNNDYEHEKYYKFKAVTDTYGHMESNVTVLVQERKYDTFVLEYVNSQSTMEVPTEGSSTSVAFVPFKSLKNGGVYNGLRYNLNEEGIDWLPQWNQAEDPIPTIDGDKVTIYFSRIGEISQDKLYVGRSTTVEVYQHDIHGQGKSLNLTVHQPPIQADNLGKYVTFRLKNNSQTMIRFGTVRVTLANDRYFEFNFDNTDLDSGDEIFKTIRKSSYFFNKHLKQPYAITIAGLNNNEITYTGLNLNSGLAENGDYLITCNHLEQ